jgi:hypothetical protein
MMTKRLLALTACLLLWSSSAYSQTIRNFGSDAERQYGVQPQQTNYPGAPVTPPAQTSQAGQPAADGKSGDEKGENAEITSGVTTMYGRMATKPLPSDMPVEQMYRGVIPGTRDSVSHLEKAAQQGKTGANELLWIGFQAREQSTRVFVQTAREANYSMDTNAEGAVVLTFTNTKLSARNFARFIDTSFFNRNVTRIESKKKGTDVIVTISLRSSERPQVNTTEKYVYLEFSASEADSTSTESTDSKESTESNRALDE